MKSINTKNLIFLSFIILANRTSAASPDHPLELFSHWALSAGPWFADAIHYVALFSEEYANKVFGDEDADSQTESFVRHVLHECGVRNSENVKVKLVKPEARDFVLSAVVCTDSTVFINPGIYNFLSKSEQRALIAKASVMMQKNHLGMNAAIMAAIPLITHFATETARALIKSHFSKSDYVKNSIIGKQLYNGTRYLLGFWATKLVINGMLASLYFEYQTKRYHNLTANKLGSQDDLLSYETKLTEFINKKKIGSQKAIGF